MPDNSTTALVKTTQSPALARVSNQLALMDKLLAKSEEPFLIPYRKGKGWVFCDQHKNVVVCGVYDYPEFTAKKKSKWYVYESGESQIWRQDQQWNKEKDTVESLIVDSGSSVVFDTYAVIKISEFTDRPSLTLVPANDAITTQVIVDGKWFTITGLRENADFYWMRKRSDNTISIGDEIKTEVEVDFIHYVEKD